MEPPIETEGAAGAAAGGESGAKRPRWWLFAAVAAPLAAAAGYGWYRKGGAEDLAGFGLGIVFGLLTALMGLWITNRQRTARGAALVREALLGTMFSMGMFAAGIVLIATSWKEALAPAVLTALPLYLAVKFFEVISKQPSPSSSGSGGKGPGKREGS